MHAAIALALVISAPSARDQARALYGQGKKLCTAGDLDGCLAKRLAGHQLFPNVKVMQAIVARLDEKGDVRAAAAFLDASIESGAPANAMKWSKSHRAGYSDALAALDQADRQTQAKADLQAEAQAKKEADKKAKDKAEADKKAAAQEKRIAEMRKRAKAHERKQAKMEWEAAQDRESRRMRLNMLGWSAAALAVGAAAGGILLALDAGAESDAAKSCQADLSDYGGACSGDRFQEHRDAQASRTATAFVAAGGAAVAAVAATGFLYLAGQVGEATAAHRSSPSLLLGPGAAWLVGRF